MILFDSAANRTPVTAGLTSAVILLGIVIIIVIIVIRRKRKGYVSLFVVGVFFGCFYLESFIFNPMET